jgi:O-Antigen ligase
VTASLFKNAHATMPFWVMVFYLVLLAVTGGSARSDTQSLTILRPVSAAVLGYAVWGLSWDRLKPFRFLFLLALAIVLLTIIHLIPLPPALWALLPGRDLVVEIDKVSGLGQIWRPLSLVPSETWNALYAMVVPLAVLALLTRLTRKQQLDLIPVLIIIGLLSGLVGLLQAIGPENSSLYFYRITNSGAAVGLFANRNHQAIVLASLFPMLAVYASVGIEIVEQWRFRSALAAIAGVFLVPLLLVTGSRAGLILGVLGLVAAALLYRRPQFVKPAKRKVYRFNSLLITGTLSVIGLIVLTILMSRAQAIDRLIAYDGTEELRFAMWPSIVQMVGKYFPFGSGFGSFVEVYQIDELMHLIDTEYVNHAHNDWLELALTGGMPALLLVSIAVFVWGRSAWKLFRLSPVGNRDVTIGRLGALIILMLAIASAADYPLRVPSIAGIIVIAAVWMRSADPETVTDAVRRSKKGGTN